MKHSANYYSELDHAYHLHSFTDLHQHEHEDSTVIERGDGIYLIDANGTRYLDAMSSLWCTTLGYSEERLVKAAYEQLSTLPYSHTFRGRSNEKLILLAEKLIAISPDHLTRVFFAGSGSEANESAIKIAWTYHKYTGNPNKQKIITRINGYHGSAIFSTHLSGMPQMHQFSNAVFSNILYADCPNYFTEATPDETEIDFANRLAKNLESLIIEHDPKTIAAFIAEPVMGVGGVVLPPESYFEQVQSILRKHNILFIADEVVCGFGRTGEMFGSTKFNLTPDILTIAKGVSSAYFPISGALVTESIYRTLVKSCNQSGVFSHGFTYSGHPVGAAIALETLNILEERKVVQHVQDVGEIFQQSVSELSRFEIVSHTRGVGLMAGFDLVKDQNKSEVFPSEVNAGLTLMNAAEKNRLFVRALGDTIVMAPPLIISQCEITQLFELLEQSIVETLKILPKI